MNGGWGNWRSWTPCSFGTRSRERLCNNPEPRNGGAQCDQNNARETRECSLNCEGSGTRIYFAKTNKCYKLITDLMTWSKARENCQTEGGELASVLDEAANNFLKNNFSTPNNVWIGGSKEDDSSGWTWSDGAEWGYQNFSNEYQEDEEGHLLFNSSDGSWIVSSTSKERSSLCQFSFPGKYLDDNDMSVLMLILMLILL